MSAIYAVWLREVKRYLRSRPRIVAALGQPLLYVLVLGFGLRPTFQKAGHGDYLEFIVPGVVGMSILFAAFVSGTKLLWDRQVGFLKETLVAPVPRLAIMLGRVVGGATTAFIQGSLVLAVFVLIGFRPDTLKAVPLALLFMALIALVFSALGTVIGSRLQDLDAFQLFTSFLLMPLFFLSSALFPLSDLPPVLAFLTRLDPLTYGIDGLRGALIGTAHIAVVVNVLTLAVLAVAFVGLATWTFAKIEV